MTTHEEEIKHFLENTRLSKYQHIELPYGLEIPGRDHSRKVEAVFSESLEGKSVLDVGCYYGLYCHEAKKRGAARVVGLEIDPVRYTAAEKIAKFMNNGVEIIPGDIMEVELEGNFDIILLLSVLHHLKDPLSVMRRLASLCSGTVIVEFCLPTHPLKHKIHLEREEDWIKRLMSKFNNSFQRRLLSLLGNRIGLIVTGEVLGELGQDYDWTYFYNQKGFRTVFEMHHGLFDNIVFRAGPLKRNRLLAFCKVATTASYHPSFK